MYNNFFSRINEITMAFWDFFKASDDTSILTNQMLINNIAEHFKKEINTLSTDDIVLFPMSFTVFLENNDFARLSSSFPFIVGSIVRSLYKVIRKTDSALLQLSLKRGLGKTINFRKITPPAIEWSFIFTKCDDINMLGIEQHITPGFIVCLSSLNTILLSSTSQLSITGNASVSVSCQNSQPGNNLNINYDSIKNINIIGANQFRVKFNKELEFIETDASHDSRINSNLQNELGKLVYKNGNEKYTYSICENLVSISGSNDHRLQKTIFKLPVTDVKPDHIQIKYVQSEKLFYVASMGEGTRINQLGLEKSDGGNIKWKMLPNNSEILIFSSRGNPISVHFLMSENLIM